MWITLTQAWRGKPAGETLEVSKEVGELLIEQKLATAAAHPAKSLVDQAIDDINNGLDERISKAINAGLEQFLKAQGLARKLATPAIFGDAGGDPKKCFGDWLCAVARGDRKYLETHYKSEFVQYSAKAALGEASGVTGGYIVPPEFSQQLQALIGEKAVIRPNAFVQPMGSATMMIPYLDVTTAQAAGTSPFFGGVKFNWTEEAQTRTETEPQFKMMELKAHELSGYAVSSNVLLQDAAFGLEKFLMTLFSGAIAWYEDYAFIQGNGQGKPQGLVNAGCAIKFNRSGGAGTATFSLSDAAKMLSRLLPASLKSAIWIVHPYSIEKLTQLADASGRVVWIANQTASSIGGAAQTKIPGQLFGLPVYVSEKCSAFGSGAGDIILTDPQLYVVGDRMQVEIAASEHVNFLANQMTWRVVERVDGQPWLEKAVTLADGSSTVSSIVMIN